MIAHRHIGPSANGHEFIDTNAFIRFFANDDLHKCSQAADLSKSVGCRR
jgi:hypothetical protein